MQSFINFKSTSDRLTAMGRGLRTTTVNNSLAPDLPKKSVDKPSAATFEPDTRPPSPARPQPTHADQGPTLPRPSPEAPVQGPTLPRPSPEAPLHKPAPLQPIAEADPSSSRSPRPARAALAAPPLGLDGEPLHCLGNTGPTLWPLPASTGIITDNLPRTLRLDSADAVDLLSGDASVAVVTDSYVQLLSIDGAALRKAGEVGREDKSLTDKLRGNAPWMRAARSGNVLIQVNANGISGYDLGAKDTAAWHQSCLTMPRSVAVGSRFVAIQPRVGNKVALHCLDAGLQAFSIVLTGGLNMPRSPMTFVESALLAGLPSGKLELFEPPERLPKKVESVPRQALVETNLDTPVTSLASSPTGGIVVGTETGSLAMGELRFRPARVNDVTVERAHFGPVTAVAIHADLVASGGKDRAVHLWDRRSGTLLETIGGFCGPIQSLVLTQGHVGVTTRKDPRVCVWPLRLGQ